VKHRALTLTSRLAPLLRAGLVGGVVLAAAVYPIAAVGGLGAKAGAERFGELPANFTTVPPAQTTYVYAADGRTLLTSFYEEHRRYIPLAQMSQTIQHAIVAAEDARFYHHHGVDPRGILRAFVANRENGEVAQGASTITMQYVRASLRDSAQTPAEVQAATEQTTTRKLREMKLALELEKQLSKQEILERYLNTAYFGHRAYGIFAAAQVFFSKRPADLSVVEAATLAGLVKAPSEYDPAAKNGAQAMERRNYVIDRMVDLKYVSRVDADAAKQQPIRLKLTDPPNDCVSVPRKYSYWGFFCDYLRTWWLNQPAFGDTYAERESRLRRGGYRIVTTLDTKLEAGVQRLILENQPASSRYAHGTVVIEPRTGRIRALTVNRHFALDQSHNPRRGGASSRRASYPNTVNPLLGGGDLPGYQAGSTFKMFTMLASLNAGLKMNTTFYAPQRYRSIYLSDPGEPASCGGRWCPQNANASMTGRQNMWTGFGKSVNTYFVQLEQKVGAQNAVRMAERLGLRWRTDIDRLQASKKKAAGWGAFTLGVADTTPLEMANAYATVAAEGTYCEPLPVQAIVGADGRPATYRNKNVAAPRCRMVLSPAVTRAATDAARCVTGYGAARGKCGEWSTASQVYPMVGRPVAGKTGTTDNTRAAWFVGFTPDLAAASFLSNPDNPRDAVGSYNYWKPIKSVSMALHDALKGRPKRDFTPPPASMLK
jgi:membrane peptidoglycan carboxypeptidase